MNLAKISQMGCLAALLLCIFCRAGFAALNLPANVKVALSSIKKEKNVAEGMVESFKRTKKDKLDSAKQGYRPNTIEYRNEEKRLQELETRARKYYSLAAAEFNQVLDDVILDMRSGKFSSDPAYQAKIDSALRARANFQNELNSITLTMGPRELSGLLDSIPSLADSIMKHCVDITKYMLERDDKAKREFEDLLKGYRWKNWDDIKIQQ